MTKDSDGKRWTPNTRTSTPYKLVDVDQRRIRRQPAGARTARQTAGSTMDPQLMTDDFDHLPDVRDGLNRKERAVLYCLQQTQRELGGRNVPTIMLYGRVVELVDMSQEEFQAILNRLVTQAPPGKPR